MAETTPDEHWLAEQFEEHRPRLGAIAYRMLGSLPQAEDAVQDAWVRLSRSGVRHDERHHLVADVRPPGLRAEIEPALHERPEAEVRRERRRQQEARVGHLSRIVERHAEAVEGVGRSHPAGAPLLRADGSIATPSFPFRGAPVLLYRIVDQVKASVDPGLAPIPIDRVTSAIRPSKRTSTTSSAHARSRPASNRSSERIATPAGNPRSASGGRAARVQSSNLIPTTSAKPSTSSSSMGRAALATTRSRSRPPDWASFRLGRADP